METSYASRLAQLQADYDSVYDRIERSGGVDYKGELIKLAKEIEAARRLAAKFEKMRAAVESSSSQKTARLIVDTLVDHGEDPEEIAADFIENEVGRLDWVNNWQLLSTRENLVNKVSRYLQTYNLSADPQEIVNIINQMAQTNPGRWR